MQRRGVASLRVSAVDVLWGTQLLNPGQAALLCRIQQGSVAPQQVLDVRVSIFDHVQGYVAITVFLGRVGAVLNNQVLRETPGAVVDGTLTTNTRVMRTHLQQQLTDLIFAFGCSLMKWRELPQVGHIH